MIVVLFRELNRAWEQDKQAWAHEMKQLLENMSSAVNDAGGVLRNKEADNGKGNIGNYWERHRLNARHPTNLKKQNEGELKGAKPEIC